MAKSMKNEKRQADKLFEKRKGLIKACLDEGILTRKGICKAADLKMYELANVFNQDKELYSLYKVRRKVISDVAVDNIHDIVNDKNHSKHFEASKWIAQNYKTELDDVLESTDSASIQIESTGEVSSPVMITFSKSKSTED